MNSPFISPTPSLPPSSPNGSASTPAVQPLEAHHLPSNSRTRPQFVELFAKSNFSFLQGASHPEEMVHTAQFLGYHGLGLCDSNGLYGVVRGFQASEQPSAFVEMNLELVIRQAQQRGFKYLIGCELILLNKQSVIVMPLNKAGYSRLSRLVTLAKRNTAKYFSRIELQTFLNHCDDQLVFPLPPWDESFLQKLSQEVGDRLYLPVYRDWSWQTEKTNQQAFRLEEEFGYQLVATQMPLMHKPERKPLHDALTCLLHKTTLHQSKNLLTLNRERHLKPLNELYQIWQDRPDLLNISYKIAQRINFSLSELRYHYPKKKLPRGMTSTDFLRAQCKKGLEQRYQKKEDRQKANAKLEYEIDIISELEYEDYFLTLWEICRFAKDRGILHQGRGSAANSVVCYTLGLTAIDPLTFSQTFERFLSKTRGEPPDIDIDFEHERREEIIQHIYKKYGSENAAMVCNVIRFRSRLALRELCKVFDVPIETVSKLIRHMGREGLKRFIESPPELENLQIDQRKFQMIISLTKELVGFPRHIGIHSCGFVISENPLIDNVPVEKATMIDRYVVQWNKDDLDTLRLMKIDILGLGMLTALKRCQELLKKHKKGSRDENWEIPSTQLDDPKTYDMIQKADTIGVFQIESRAQMSMLPRLKPKEFYDLVIEVAIVRPGPLQGGMVHPFLKRKQGLESAKSPYPVLDEILKKTMGVPIFQEQVLLIVQKIAGFTPDEAEQMRKMMSMSWYGHGSMEQLRQRLMGGMLSNGIDKEFAEKIYKMVQGFASYGFPESHAASFALLTYASSYLKCHHPDVFVCALLNSQPMGFYSPRSLISDAQKHGVQFLPLDVQHSDYNYTLEETGDGLKVRVGLRSVKGLNETVAKRIEADRKGHGCFQSFVDFIQRTQAPRIALEKLAAADAFSDFFTSSRQALWHIAGVELDSQSLLYTKAKQESQQSHWLPKESSWQKLVREYQSKGHSLEQHPLKLLRPWLNKKNRLLKQKGWVPYSSAEDILSLKDGAKIRLAGVICVHQRPPTAKGFVFLTLEDEFGMFNIVVKPPVFKTYRHAVKYRALLEIQGVLEFQQGVRNVMAQRIFTLDENSIYNKEITDSKPGNTPIGQ